VNILFIDQCAIILFDLGTEKYKQLLLPLGYENVALVVQSYSEELVPNQMQNYKRNEFLNDYF
jgi:hypothetical protein